MTENSAVDVLDVAIIVARAIGGVSDRQWRDLVSVLRVSGETMSQEYLNQWAAQLGIADLLQRAKRDASDG